MTTAELSADELALYDRQLRVWGAEGQNRIKNASVLLINFNGVGTEIVKNLTLSGIGSLELWDDAIVEEKDLSAQFFISEADLGKKRVEAAQPRINDMNPRVNLTINTSPVEFHADDTTYFQNFNLIIANNLPAVKLQALNEITRKLNITLHVTAAHGLYGYMFNDLLINVSTFTKKKMPLARKVDKISQNQEIISVTSSLDKENSQVNEHYTIKSSYKKLDDAIQSKNLTTLTRKQKKSASPWLAIFIALYELELQGQEITVESVKTQAAETQSRLGLNEITDDSLFTTIVTQLNTEISPVAAILGGTLSQDVINFLSKKEPPINNLLILDGDKCMMPIYEL